ncbi:helix-turn-helix domain-containing protein [Erysipelothrix anatis]|uniref:helix-turn-helix domain-containing protein n=1 Tax=Erysipelothrix anatis TaxID=2683713 RepID=UPI001357FD06|nr:helix-turn-helix transcriptional regulator [Erysipelothrix anatis]
MTNTQLLKILMLKKGIKQKQIAETLSITPQSVYRKVNGINEWKGSEITRIVEMLDLSREESDAIFFGKKVDFKSTTGCYDK